MLASGDMGMAHPTHLAMAATGRPDLAFSLVHQRATIAATVAANGCRRLPHILEKGPFPMSAANDAKADRLTLRLPSRDLERLRELARQRRIDVAALGREAISTYLDGADPRDGLERLAQELRTVMQSQADRVIERHEQVIRALIAALNEHSAEKP
jgi:ribbon-helix-helix CopG family protein